MSALVKGLNSNHRTHLNMEDMKCHVIKHRHMSKGWDCNTAIEDARAMEYWCKCLPNTHNADRLVVINCLAGLNAGNASPCRCLISMRPSPLVELKARGLGSSSVVQFACIALLSFLLTSCKEATKVVVTGQEWGPMSLQP